MNKPYNFDNEIVQPKNLDFLANSTDEAIKDIFTTMFGNSPGIVAGLNITATVGDGSFNVAPGYGYTGDGEKVTMYSGTNFIIAFTGSRSIYLNYVNVDYNPDPSVNPTRYVNTNIDPVSGAPIPTESYIYPQITLTSGSDYINLGTVTADSSKKFLSSSGTGRQALYLGGFLNLNDSAITGEIIESGTLDSSKFKNPLNYDIYLNTGVGIYNTSSGNMLGSVGNPFSGIFTSELTVHEIHGSSPVIIDGGIIMLAGDVLSSQSGPLYIDTTGNGVNFGGAIAIQNVNGYQDQNITTSAYGTGTIILQANDGASKIVVGSENSITGTTKILSDLILNPTVSILGSGQNSVGTSANPINNIVANTTTSTTYAGSTANISTINATTINTTNIGSISSPIQNLYVDNIISDSIANSGPHMRVFIANGNFTIPSGVTSIKIRLQGGGGGGGGGASWEGYSNDTGGGEGSPSTAGSATARGGRGGARGLDGGVPGAAISPAVVNQPGLNGIQMGSMGGGYPSNGLRLGWGGAGGAGSCGQAYDNNYNEYRTICGAAGGAGGMGEYAEFVAQVTPDSILPITIGAGGGAGAGATDASAGTAGGSGMVIIEW